MTTDDGKAMQAKPGLYLVSKPNDPDAVLVVSQGGKLYALKIDQVLVPDGFHPFAYVSRYVDLHDKVIGTEDTVL